MKPLGAEVVCCREFGPEQRQGPCIPIAIQVDRVRIRVRSQHVVCDRHNRAIVLVSPGCLQGQP